MKILLIEDDKELLSLLSLALKKEFFVIDTADDGEKGLFQFRTNTYDLLIVDHNLPEKNGRDLIKEVRAENKDIKILVLTVESGQAMKKEFFELGADDYLTKPFVFEELLLRIKALARRPQTTQESIYKIDDLVVDIEHHSVKRANRNIYLTFKELMLLEFFLKNKGKLLSRTIIMENIWDCNADPFSNTIESHILKLRKKLNPDGKKRELIHTIKGRGYKLDLKKW